MYVKTALVQWFAKNQSTVETSVFGAQFVAMKQGIDASRDLRYKLQMGVPISGLSYIYGDHILVVHKHADGNSVSYHGVHE